MRYDFWRDKRVFITGHTGFKGLWLSKWLDSLGAKVTGYSLPPDGFSLYGDSAFSREFQSVFGDVRDKKNLGEALEGSRAGIVFHLAAQAIVREAWLNPGETFSVNVMGSVNLLDALRNLPSLKAAILVTSDKVYENRETSHPYEEGDHLGGDEPYAASKAAVELAVRAYRNAYFKSGTGLATARASNVIGGGDHIQTRLIPSILNSFAAGKAIELRNPHQTRPWQSVLDALNGYLTITRLMYENPEKYSGPWNIGPVKEGIQSVLEVVERMQGFYKDNTGYTENNPFKVIEAQTLGLDITKAMDQLGWAPELSLDKMLYDLVDYFKRQQACEPERDICLRQIREFFEV
jgi:CDP-glucose 4,6-dehydratase